MGVEAKYINDFGNAQSTMRRSSATMKRPRVTRRSSILFYLFAVSNVASPVDAFPCRPVSKSVLLRVPSPVRPESAARVASVDDIGTDPSLEPWETWCVGNMEQMYRKALAIKCPFFRRRASDILDMLDQVLRFIIIRHKSLDVLGPPAGWRCQGDTCDKILNLEVEELMSILREDWKMETRKGYYITGKLSTAVYRDDCLFDGPDPDMPVRGLRKYLNAASQLFDHRSSRAELLSLEAIDDRTILAQWKMKGILRLPWKPVLPTWTGTTTYHRDDLGLIYKHSEAWDMSAFEAFVRTLLPDVAAKLYKERRSTGTEISD